MRAHLRAGIAIFDEGRYHAAHDAWEDHWLGLESGTDDEHLLHGLIQYTAVVHHAHEANYAGARGLAESASEYLAGLPRDYRGVNLDAVRPYLARVASDPEHCERTAAPELTHEGAAIGYEDLEFDATAVAAHVLAEEDGFDEDAMAAAVARAREEVDESGDGTFTGLVFGFVRQPERRAVIAQRLGEHLDREDARDADVEGLFE